MMIKRLVNTLCVLTFEPDKGFEKGIRGGNRFTVSLITALANDNDSY